MNKKYLLLLILALIISGVISLFASPYPDGLEKVAEDKSFIATALDYPFAVLMPDYSWELISNEYLATAIAGIFGTLIVFLVIYLSVKILFSKKGI